MKLMETKSNAIYLSGLTLKSGVLYKPLRNVFHNFDVDHVNIRSSMPYILV